MSTTVGHSHLTWFASRALGSLEHDGVHVRLHARPRVLPHIKTIEELVYSPTGGTACYVQEVGQQRRDLEPGERELCMLWLRAVAQRVRDHALGAV